MPKISETLLKKRRYSAEDEDYDFLAETEKRAKKKQNAEPPKKVEKHKPASKPKAKPKPKPEVQIDFEEDLPEEVITGATKVSEPENEIESPKTYHSNEFLAVIDHISDLDLSLREMKIVLKFFYLAEGQLDTPVSISLKDLEKMTKMEKISSTINQLVGKDILSKQKGGTRESNQYSVRRDFFPF